MNDTRSDNEMLQAVRKTWEAPRLSSVEITKTSGGFAGSGESFDPLVQPS